MGLLTSPLVASQNVKASFGLNMFMLAFNYVKTLLALYNAKASFDRIVYLVYVKDYYGLILCQGLL